MDEGITAKLILLNLENPIPLCIITILIYILVCLLTKSHKEEQEQKLDEWGETLYHSDACVLFLACSTSPFFIFT